MKKFSILFLVLMMPLVLFGAGVNVEENPIFDIPNDQLVITSTPDFAPVNQAERSSEITIAINATDAELKNMDDTIDYNEINENLRLYAAETRRDVPVILKNPILTSGKLDNAENTLEETVWQPVVGFVMLA